MLQRFGFTSILLALLAAVWLVPSSALAQESIKGQRVYSSGHSFHFFMPPILADIAKKAHIKDHKQFGLSAIGGSRVIQHWITQTVVAKQSEGATLPTDTIFVNAAARFAPAGQFTVKTSDGEAVVTYTGIKEIEREKKTDKEREKGKTPVKERLYAFTGCKGGQGTLAAGNAIKQEENAIRQVIKAGAVDVLTLSPIYLPDDGINNFVKLAIDNNPKIRIFVQENWLPWDHYDVAFKKPKEEVDHNAPTADSLRTMHEPYFKAIDEHVADLNKQHDTKAVHVAPVGQAVIALRAKIIAGEAPGLKKQSDLFTDEIGHAKAPHQALVAYVYYAAIYKRSPVGLPMPAVLGKATADGEKLNRLLQEIAWQAVTAHPLSGVKLEVKR
jgi:hypothetical protein